MKRHWIITAAVVLPLLYLVLTSLVAMRSPIQVFRRCLSPSLSNGVVILHVQQGKLFGRNRATYLSFTIESNAFNQIVQEQQFQEAPAGVLENAPLPAWFEPMRTQNLVYLHFTDDRGLFGGPRRYIELLGLDGTGTNAYFYRSRVGIFD